MVQGNRVAGDAGCERGSRAVLHIGCRIDRQREVAVARQAGEGDRVILWPVFNGDAGMRHRAAARNHEVRLVVKIDYVLAKVHQKGNAAGVCWIRGAGCNGFGHGRRGDIRAYVDFVVRAVGREVGVGIAVEAEPTSPAEHGVLGRRHHEGAGVVRVVLDLDVEIGIGCKSLGRIKVDLGVARPRVGVGLCGQKSRRRPGVPAAVHGNGVVRGAGEDKIGAHPLEDAAAGRCKVYDPVVVPVVAGEGLALRAQAVIAQRIAEQSRHRRHVAGHVRGAIPREVAEGDIRGGPVIVFAVGVARVVEYGRPRREEVAGIAQIRLGVQLVESVRLFHIHFFQAFRPVVGDVIVHVQDHRATARQVLVESRGRVCGTPLIAVADQKILPILIGVDGYKQRIRVLVEGGYRHTGRIGGNHRGGQPAHGLLAPCIEVTRLRAVGPQPEPVAHGAPTPDAVGAVIEVVEVGQVIHVVPHLVTIDPDSAQAGCAVALGRREIVPHFHTVYGLG